MKPDIKWTDDCGGKKDYDGSIVSISTRYYPQGGGFFTFDTSKPEKGFQGNEARPQIKPHASSALFLDEEGGAIDLISEDFKGETQAEVQLQVEKWVKDQFDIITSLIKTRYEIHEQPEETP